MPDGIALVGLTGGAPRIGTGPMGSGNRWCCCDRPGQLVGEFPRLPSRHADLGMSAFGPQHSSRDTLVSHPP